MTKPIILKAKNFDDMESIAKPFIDNGYKIMSSDAKHIIAKKRNFGIWYFHVLFLGLILFIVSYNSWILYLVCLLYIAYFLFYLFKRSKIVLITTESKDEEGNYVEFDDIKDINY
ncbi:hypothetical protein KQY27_00030 [Methanobrevibacter sp. TMH8]|uniref:hypothetical protein n=1 Tax=Methanobrevibacter sp. TMH8 TaxID=2848611 RepID=UPI001CD01628|nr:hypothetical protein [Methanobrevibacter sp. TMH8]MBZ9569945.1 hypothetical protein [Methanobrevibacter sp. TMH8]